MERPILFNTEMVRAIMNGRKTQTRRIVKPQPPNDYNWFGWVQDSTDNKHIGCATWIDEKEIPHHAKPTCSIGDILWVRETWAWGRRVDNIAVYKADGFEMPVGMSWHPSIHMPRDAARLFLQVKDVRVERVQDITEEAAKVEGIGRLHGDMDSEEFDIWRGNLKLRTGKDVGNQNQQPWKNYIWHGMEDVIQKQINEWPYQYSAYDSAKESFSSLWQKVYENWTDNPWVWVIEFEKI